MNTRNINMNIKIHETPPYEMYDEIYGTIVLRIISKYDTPNNMFPTSVEFNAVIQPKVQVSFASEIVKKMEEARMLIDLYGHVSRETYTARLMMYSIIKRPIPIFASKISFRMRQFIEEMENKFITSNIREELMNIFCKSKRIYWAFTKLARIWKIRHIPIRIQTDLYMNELDPTHKHTFQLIHKNGIYLFSLQNLMRMIVDAITHQTGMFLEPLSIKNPYTNDLLSKCDLFAIYLSSRWAHLRIHEMMENFFRCEFNIFEFRRKHETELRDIAIDQYASTASTVELAQDVDDMLRSHKMSNRIKIMPGFPQKQLVETMRPFLKVYLMERFSFSSMTRKYSAKKLDLALNRFAEKNPTYGKQIVLSGKVSGKIENPFNSASMNATTQLGLTTKSYITNTINTNEYCRTAYMNTHIYNENTFDRYIEVGDNIEAYREDPLDNDVFIFNSSPFVYIFTHQTRVPINHILAISSETPDANVNTANEHTANEHTANMNTANMNTANMNTANEHTTNEESEDELDNVNNNDSDENSDEDVVINNTEEEEESQSDSEEEEYEDNDSIS